MQGASCKSARSERCIPEAILLALVMHPAFSHCCRPRSGPEENMDLSVARSALLRMRGRGLSVIGEAILDAARATPHLSCHFSTLLSSKFFESTCLVISCLRQFDSKRSGTTDPKSGRFNRLDCDYHDLIFLHRSRSVQCPSTAVLEG